MTAQAPIRGAAAIPRRPLDRSPAVDRPRVVMLSTWHPEPADNGRKQRTRNMIDALSSDFDVVLVSLLPAHELAASTALVPNVAVQVVATLPDDATQAQRAVSSLQRYPRSQVMLWSTDTARRIRELVELVGGQVVIGTDLRTVRYLTALPPDCHAILDEPDVSPFVPGGTHTASPAGRLRAHARSRKYRHLLCDTAVHLDAVVVASEHEAAAYRAFVATARPAVIENAIWELPALAWRAPQGVDLIYTGSITYPPNLAAVRFMQGEVLPRLAQRYPGLRLLVTGALGDAIPADVTDGRIVFTGRLPSLDDTLRSARIFVCPLWSGTGTRIKLIEAMSYRLPIVTSAKGAEGLAIEPEVHALFAENGDQFAAAIERLLNDPALCLKLGANARQLVRERYTWAVQGERLRRLVRSTLAVGEGRLLHG